MEKLDDESKERQSGRFDDSEVFLLVFATGTSPPAEEVADIGRGPLGNGEITKTVNGLSKRLLIVVCATLMDSRAGVSAIQSSSPDRRSVDVLAKVNFSHRNPAQSTRLLRRNELCSKRTTASLVR